MSAIKIANCWKDILGSEYQLDHDADEVIWRFPNCTVIVSECVYNVHEVMICVGGEPIFIMKGEPDRLEQVVKAIQK